MKKIIFSYLILLCAFKGFGQQKITITGKIELLSSSKNIVLSTQSGNHIIPISIDNTFNYEFNIEEPGTGLIRTDSSGATSIWLEKGAYNCNFKEIKSSYSKKPLFRTSFIKANQNAELHTFFNETSYTIKGKTAEESKQLQRDFAIKFLDSAINLNSKSAIIPEIIRLRQSYLGDSLANAYVSKIEKASNNNEANSAIDIIENTTKRNEKIKREVYIEKFEMKNSDGKTFSIASVKSKKIVLIDFWASWCVPCRSNHKNLKVLHDKYSKKGFDIVGVSLDDNKKAWLDAIALDKINWTNVSDLKRYKSNLIKNYWIQAIPFNLVIDGNGKIIGVDLSNGELEALLIKL